MPPDQPEAQRLADQLRHALATGDDDAARQALRAINQLLREDTDD